MEHCKKMAHNLCARWVRDSPDRIAVKQLLFWALTLAVFPLAALLLLNIVLFPHKSLGLTWYWHLHVHAYRCNQIIHRQIRIPWPWRSLLACWWPGTFKNTIYIYILIRKGKALKPIISFKSTLNISTCLDLVFIRISHFWKAISYFKGHIRIIFHLSMKGSLSQI